VQSKKIIDIKTLAQRRFLGEKKMRRLNFAMECGTPIPSIIFPYL